MENKHEQYTLNKFCEFKNREVEFAFMEYEHSSSLGTVRLFTLVMGIIFGSFVIWDYFFHVEEQAFIISAVLRGAGLITALTAVVLAGKLKRHDYTLLVITIAELVIFAIYLLNLYNRKTSNAALQFMSVMLIILAVFLIPNRWKNCLIAGGVIWIGYFIYCNIFQDTAVSPTPVQQGIYLGVCFMSCNFFIYGREKSERKHFAAEQLLEYASITDGLTGIYNRKHFEYTLGLWIKNKRHDPFCLLFFDIDNFKKVNDTLGHHTGDAVLIGTTNIVSANIRDEDVFARWGGEEFVLLFSGISIYKGTELAERLRKVIEENTCGGTVKITVSIGVVQYRREENTEERIEEFIRRADEKMYEAKNAGKNRVMAES